MEPYSVIRILAIAGAAVSAVFAAKSPHELEKALHGKWKLAALTCNGVSQTLENDYELSFSGNSGNYLSLAKGCQQIEPEIYRYLSGNKVSIKSGVRSCTPNPCAADLPGQECGKETNPSVVVFDVDLREKDAFVLSTSDPKSVDCIGPGQKKPAVFTFTRKGG